MILIIYFLIGMLVYNLLYSNLFYNKKFEPILLELLGLGASYSEINVLLFLSSLVWPALLIYILIR